MRKLWAVLLFILTGSISFGQEAATESFLILRLGHQYDRTNKKNYVFIAAEPYNPNAKGLYDLVPYSDKPSENGMPASFYYQKTDSLTLFYNYFRNQTEALLFLSEQQWQLFSIISEVESGYNTERAGDVYMPYTTVTSRPVYYYRKLKK